MRRKSERLLMPIGTVKYVNPDEGFGFISRDDKQPKVFLHVSEVQKRPDCTQSRKVSAGFSMLKIVEG
jgi:cold shock CspA family protein